MLCAVQRPACLDRVPEWVEAYLRKCPRSPEGVHQWLASAAHKTFAYLEAQEQAKALKWAMYVSNCGRDPQPHEIENTVANIRRKREHEETSGALYQAWPLPVHGEVNKLVREWNNGR